MDDCQRSYTLARCFGEYVTQLQDESASLGESGHSQEDMISFGFSARHWQQVEAGRSITLTTLLRICEALEVRLTTLLAGLGRQSRR